MAEFPAELFGLAFLLAAALLASRPQRSKQEVALAAAAPVVAVWSQPVLMIAAVLFGICGWIASAWDSDGWAGKTWLWVLPLWLAPALLARLGSAFVPTLLRGSLLEWPQWPVGTVGTWGKPLLLVAAAVWLLTAAHGSRLTRWAQAGGTAAALFSLLILFNPYLYFQGDSRSAVGQLDGLSFVLFAFLGPMAAFCLWRQRRLWAAPVAVVAGVMASSLGGLPPGLQPGWLRARAQLADELTLHRGQIPAGGAIITPPQEAALAGFILKPTRVAASASTLTPGERSRALWLLHEVPASFSSPEVVFLRSDSAARNTAEALVPDLVLQARWDTASPAALALLLRANPGLSASIKR